MSEPKQKGERVVNIFGNTPTGGSGGEPPMSNLEARVEHLETDVHTLRQDVAVIKATMATKEDLVGQVGSLRSEMHSLLRQQTMWSVGTIIAMAGLVFAIMRFLPT